MRKTIISLLIIIIIALSCKEEVIAPVEIKYPPTEKPKDSIATGDIIGKLVVGYQGWFGCAGDGSTRNTWVHWGVGSGQPRPGSLSFELYPDISEYSTTYQTGFANFGNGQPARLFSSNDDNVVNTHFEWMQNYGIDCAALQRFGSEFSTLSIKLQRDGMALRVKNAAQTYGRKFYIMYDISGWTNFQNEIKTDWTNTIIGSLALTTSSAYAKENGKPVVCIWGMGVSTRPGDATSWLDVVNWFKSQGCYVIVGTAKNWRSQPENMSVYKAANMIQPWHVGSFNASSLSNQLTVVEEDLAYCKVNSLAYVPVTWPGFAWSNWNGGAPNSTPRMHGDFMWSQFYNYKLKFDAAGVKASAYVAMFDEYDEGTAIAKAAENASMIPTNQYFLTLDADGVAVTSDFYLRLTGDGAKMLKGKIPMTATHPTVHNSTNNAEFVSQTGVPTTLAPGQTATVSVTMKNTGTTTWTKTNLTKLGSFNPQDNTLLCPNRIELNTDESIAPNQTKTFTFVIVAPATAGTFNFQWKMLQDGIGWFGKASTNQVINPIQVSGVTLTPATASITINNTQQLTANVLPADAFNKKVIWTTSNATVATVNLSGLVTAVSLGTATITATTEDGSKTSSSAITVNLAPYTMFDNCDELSGWNSGLSLNTLEVKQGTACIEFTGSGTDEFKRAYSTPYYSGETVATCKLSFWYYVSDVSKVGNVNIEIGSAGAPDVNEYQWGVSASKLINGWNKIVLNTSNASVRGIPNLNAINWFRIFDVKTGSITTRIDAIEITH